MKNHSFLQAFLWLESGRFCENGRNDGVGSIAAISFRSDCKIIGEFAIEFYIKWDNICSAEDQNKEGETDGCIAKNPHLWTGIYVFVWLLDLQLLRNCCKRIYALDDDIARWNCGDTALLDAWDSSTAHFIFTGIIRCLYDYRTGDGGWRSG